VCKGHLHNAIARDVQHLLLGLHDCEMKFPHQKRSKPHDKVQVGFKKGMVICINLKNTNTSKTNRQHEQLLSELIFRKWGSVRRGVWPPEHIKNASH
jgi:hypothetical protein